MRQEPSFDWLQNAATHAPLRLSALTETKRRKQRQRRSEEACMSLRSADGAPDGGEREANSPLVIGKYRYFLGSAEAIALVGRNT